MRAVESDESNVVRNLLFSFVALLLVILMGTVGYHILGGPHYSWMDCFYMTFITITTIGYVEAVDVNGYEYGRLFTVFVGVAGIGTMGYVLSTLTAFMLERDLNETWRRKKMRQQIERLNNHFIVCGIGLVGKNVTHELALTGRDCVIIDPKLDAIKQYLESHPKQLYLVGDATDNDVLLAAGVMNARGVFAVAHDDSQNLVISLSAKQLNPKLRVVARCHDLKNTEKTRRAGADEVVSPDFTGGQRIVSAMITPQVVSFLDDMLKSKDNVRMEEIIVSQRVSGKSLTALYQDNQDCLVLALNNAEGWMFNPSPQHVVKGGEVLMVMATPEGRMKMEQVMQGEA